MPLRLPARKPHKYMAKPCVIDGVRFASQREGKRYLELKALEQAGEIHHLMLQPEFELLAAMSFIGKYRADFAYWDGTTGQQVVEDAKGFRTPLYKWKKRHVEAQYGIQIREI